MPAILRTICLCCKFVLLVFPRPTRFIYLTHFHAYYASQCLQNACDKHDKTFYATRKRECDEYFTNKHRNECRGIGAKHNLRCFWFLGCKLQYFTNLPQAEYLPSPSRSDRNSKILNLSHRWLVHSPPPISQLSAHI